MKRISLSLMGVVLVVGMFGTSLVSVGAAARKEPGTISLRSVLADARQRILKEADGNEITEVKIVYEAHWIFDGNEVEILVGANGEFLSRTVDAADDNDADVDPNDFVATIDNQYYPLTPGTTFFYEGTTEGTPTTAEVNITHDTNTIIGVTTTIVRDRVFLNGVLSEDTNDFYAQDNIGNVWYFGEDAKQYDVNGVLVGTEGSWKAGVDGAKPGIVMEAYPHTGDKYQQEFATGVAEDRATVLSVNTRATVPYGSFTHCLETKDYSLLEPDTVEHKYFAPGVGFTLSVMVKGGSERLQLVNITHE
ncbi:MAG: hypothetical protein WAK60_00575 [Sedimentisphaerales bacterium]